MIKIPYFTRIQDAAKKTNIRSTRLLEFGVVESISFYIEVPKGIIAKFEAACSDPKIFRYPDPVIGRPSLLRLKPSHCRDILNNKKCSSDDFSFAICFFEAQYTKRPTWDDFANEGHSSPDDVTAKDNFDYHTTSVADNFLTLRGDDQHLAFRELPAYWYKQLDSFNNPEWSWRTYNSKDEKAMLIEITSSKLFVSDTDIQAILNPKQFDKMHSALRPLFYEEAKRKNKSLRTKNTSTQSELPNKHKERHERRRQCIINAALQVAEKNPDHCSNFKDWVDIIFDQRDTIFRDVPKPEPSRKGTLELLQERCSFFDGVPSRKVSGQ